MRLTLLGCVVLLILGGAAARAEESPGFRHGVNIVAWPWAAADKNGPIEARIDRAKAAGFDFVRIGVEITPRLKQGDDANLTRTVQAVVARTQADSMSLLLTLFARDPGGYRTGRLICGTEGEPQRYVEAFRQVVAELPDRASVAIEPLNEPPGGCSAQRNGVAMGPEWPRMQLQLYQLLRKDKPHVTYIVNAGYWSDLDGLLSFDPSPYLADPNALMIFHYYEPKLFTQQGMVFTPEQRAARHIPWPVEDPGRLEQSRSDSLHALEEDSGDFDRRKVRSKFEADFDRYASEGRIDHLRARFQAAENWARRYGLDPRRIVVTEFGVARASHSTDGPPPPDGARYLSSVRAAAEGHGFGWAIWDLDTGFAILCGAAPDEKVCPEYASVVPAGH